MAVVDDPTAKVVQLKAGKGKDVSRPHKPHLDEMGIATYHEAVPARSGKARKPTLDERGPGTESRIFQPTNSRESGPEFGPRSTGGAPGKRGGWKKR